MVWWTSDDGWECAQSLHEHNESVWEREREQERRQPPHIFHDKNSRLAADVREGGGGWRDKRGEGASRSPKSHSVGQLRMRWGTAHEGTALAAYHLRVMIITISQSSGLTEIDRLRLIVSLSQPRVLT